jgi:hypothetical protein
MTITLCFWTLAWGNIGLTSSWLHLLPLASGFLSVLYLVMRSVMRERKITLKSMATASLTWIKKLQFWKSSSRYEKRKDHDRSGENAGSGSLGRVATLAVCVVVATIGMFSIPVEHAAVVNQVKTTGMIYFPHVEQEMGNYDFLADPDGDTTKRMPLHFCADKGFKPPFDEGETLKWMRYKAWGDCLELLGADPVRDANGNVERK